MKARRERDCNFVEYFFRRIFSSLLYSRIYRKLFPKNPFYVPAAIRKIDSLLNKDLKVFEWGSGISTIYFAKRVKELITVEHDKEWYERGLKTFEKEKIDNVKLIFSSPKDMETFSWQKEWKYYRILMHPPRKPQFKDYMSVIDQYPDLYFDCIAIDGRERVGCLLHALPKLSEEGFIILDDSHRPQYNEIFKILSKWNVKKFNFGLLQTTLFFRK